MPSTSSLTSEQLAIFCAQSALNKKAEDIVILDLRGVSTFTDFFLICSGTSEPQLKAIANEIESQLRQEHGTKPRRVDGFPLSQWVVVDLGDVVVHIFHESKRRLYALEDLWGEVPRLALPE
jgi:ribosome-associated protein